MTEAPAASFEQALAHAVRLLDARPDLAERQAREMLAQLPGEPRARMLLGAALRHQGQAPAARDVLEPLAHEQPKSPQTHLELGLVLAGLGDSDAALAALRHAVSLRSDLPDAWRVIAEQLYLLGDTAGADEAYARHIQTGVRDPALRVAALALVEDRLAVAEHLLRERLKTHPADVAAMRMLAEAGTRLGRYADAEGLLEHCLDLSPSFHAARHNLAIVLYRQQKAADALPHIERLRDSDPLDPGLRNLHAACLGLIGEYGHAIDLFQAILDRSPEQPRIWLSLGHALRTAGRRSEAVAAYKRAIELEPGLGDAYWSLANLKTEPFADDEVAAMEGQLRRPEVAGEDRFHLHYALGKALEDRADFDGSFTHYAEGARLRRAEAPYDPEEFEDLLARSKALFTRDFFAERLGWGAASEAPIFVVGLPRSGSTLIEQILASHSAVEGTMELPDVGLIARDLGWSSPGADYPARLADLSREAAAALGRRFIEATRAQRRLGRRFFVDKMPNNFQHLGLIQLMLPRARIIDARRHPCGACVSAFKQHFADAQAFTYDLGDLGRYYRDYVALMDHFDAVLPGRVHRVIYEDMVEDTEGEVRRLLAHCGLDFEPACLAFHENDRAVRTVSSEQVRRPIYRDALDQWRRFEPWLGPLKDALGPALEGWRRAE